ncbi:MAG: hypothetical protein HOK84_17075 [Bacteroidetes bacterium]|nr:hypothetical protein [Bacteroidota bacterium]MBT5427921.1 hypothetical protein [Bacteroidota bacterium]
MLNLFPLGSMVLQEEMNDQQIDQFRVRKKFQKENSKPDETDYHGKPKLAFNIVLESANCNI